MFDDLIDPFRYPFMQRAFLAAVLASLACASIGTYVVLRRMAFLGDALAHAVLPGLVVAYLFKVHLMIGALVAGIATALGIGAISRRGEVHEDSAIGILFTAMFALGIVLMTTSGRAGGSGDQLTHMLIGNLLSITDFDLWLMAGVTALVLAVLVLAHKELAITTCDPVYSSSIGLRPELVRYLLLIVLALAIVTAIQATGVLLTSALLVTPPATARLVTRRLPRMIMLSVGVALVATVIGFYWSAADEKGVSYGAAIILVCTAIFFLVWLGKRIAGVRAGQLAA